MKVSRKVLTVSGCLLYLLIIVFHPLPADASKLIYTIQVASFKDIERTTRQYHSVIDRLNKEELNNLRIEKIGQYYSIRLGNFVDPINAKNLHRSVHHFFSSTILMKAYMKNERIIKRYSYTSSMNKEKQNDITYTSEISEITKPLISDEKKEVEDRLYYTIQIGSFIPLDRALVEFASAIQKLLDTKPNHVRIEKIGEYYTVRIGKFAEYVRAEKYFSSVRTHFVSAFIIQAYIRDKRIVRQLREDPTQKKEGANFQAKPFNSINPVNSSHDSGFTDDTQSEIYITLPVSEKLILQGTIIANNVRLAIIEDSDSKQSGLYNLNDKIGGFIVSDIFKNTVILNENNTMVKILLWEDSKIALLNPEPDLSQEIEGKDYELIRKGVRGTSGRRERILRLRRRQLNR